MKGGRNVAHILPIPITEGNPMPKPFDPREQDVVERTRLEAIERIHAAEMERLEDALVSYEIERANARHQLRMFCEQFGSNHVAEWVLQEAKALGHRL